MFAADGKVYVSLSTTAGIEGSFGEMFFDGRLGAVVVGMELEEAFRQLSVVQSVCSQHVGNHFFVVSFFEQGINAFSFVEEASIVQGIEEGEVMDVCEEGFLEVGGWGVVVGIEELEHILEHAAGSSAGWHELGDGVPFSLIVVPGLDVSLCFVLCRSQYAIAYGSSPTQLQEVEAFAETL